MKASESIIQEIEKHLCNGHTIESLRKFLSIEALKNGGCADLTFKNGGFRIFYTSNTNYGNGAKNGYGAGLYASLKFTGYFKTVKL
jgi:hypothetical protein